MIPPCLTLSIIRYVSRVKWSNPGKGVAPSPTPRCSSYWKGSLLVVLDYSRQLYFYYIILSMISMQYHMPFPTANALTGLPQGAVTFQWVFTVKQLQYVCIHINSQSIVLSWNCADKLCVRFACFIWLMLSGHWPNQ